MNGQNKDSKIKTQRNDSHKWTFFKALADGLRPRPEYTLILSLSALFFIFGLGSGVAAAVQNNPQLWQLAFGGLLASLIAAVAVIWRVQPPQPTIVITEPQRQPRASGDQKFDEVLYAIQDEIDRALMFKNETFHEAILQECEDFRGVAADWAEGRIRASGHYNLLLLRYYERAQTVFSTSLPEYLTTWETPFGHWPSVDGGPSEEQGIRHTAFYLQQPRRDRTKCD
jgi:hypothetical protein